MILMRWARDRRAGFTIIELLIVIVVIGILAVIVVSALQGTVTKATNTAITDSAAKWNRLMKLYVAQREDAPLSSYSCVGSDASDFPATADMPAGVCIQGYPSQANWQESYSTPYLGKDIREWVGQNASIPTGLTPEVRGTIGNTPIIARGIAYKNGKILMYYLKGSGANCSPGEQMFAPRTGDTVTACTLRVVN